MSVASGAWARRSAPVILRTVPSNISSAKRISDNQNAQFSNESIASSATPSRFVFRPGGRSSVSGLVATVFGGSGFIAPYIVNRLGRTGSQVIAPYRCDGMNLRKLKQMGDLGQIVMVPYSMSDEKSIERAVSRSSVVINTIGKWAETRAYTYEDTHVKCTYRLAKVAAEAGVRRFIHISSVAVDKNHKSSWLRTKAEGEEIVRSFFPDATIIRLCPVYGDEDLTLNRIASVLNAFPIFPLINDGQWKVQPVFVNDVANAVLACVLDNDTAGKTFEIGGDKAVSFKQLVKMVAEIIFREPNFVNWNVALARAYLRLRNRYDRTPTFPTDLLDQMSSDFVVSPSTAARRVYTLADLDLKPSPLDLTMRAYLVRFRQHRDSASSPPRIQSMDR